MGPAPQMEFPGSPQRAGFLRHGFRQLLPGLDWSLRDYPRDDCRHEVNKGPILAVLVSILAIIGAYLFLSLNSHGWESNRLLSIGIGGGLGWIMLLNVCGIIWRNNNKIIRSTKENAANGTAIPPQSATLARQGFLASRTNAFLSIPMLFFMAAASHYPMFGR